MQQKNSFANAGDAVPSVVQTINLHIRTICTTCITNVINSHQQSGIVRHISDWLSVVHCHHAVCIAGKVTCQRVAVLIEHTIKLIGLGLACYHRQIQRNCICVQVCNRSITAATLGNANRNQHTANLRTAMNLSKHSSVACLVHLTQNGVADNTVCDLCCVL